jgi:uncharacterized damage-inducible protein DinB
MNLHQHLRLMADHHVWAYERLFERVDALAYADYVRDVGLFFGSVHRTLNHILLVDLLWRARLEGRPNAFTRLDEELAAGRDALKDAALSGARGWIPHVAAMSEADLGGVFTYQTVGENAGKTLSLSRPGIILAVFNHAVHHRGQISAVLTQLGQSVPEMCLTYFMLDHPETWLHAG